MKAVTLILFAYLAPTLLADSPHEVLHGYGQSLTPLEQEKYGKILNFAFDVRNTPMGDFLRGAQFPNIEKIQKLSFQSIVDAIKTDEEFAKIAGENFKQYAENVIARKTKSKSSGGPSASQTDGYDGCWLDYAAFVEPITNALYMLARPTLCEILFPGPFCLLPVLDVPEQTDWGLNMIDAMGKIPPGILDGNIHWVGAYQMCMEDFIDVKYNNTLGAEVEERQFSGQYCRLRFGTQDPVVLNISLPLFLGVCVPDTCTTEYVERYISNPLQGNLVLGTILAFLELDVDNVFCGQEVNASEDQGFQAVIGILIGLAVLVVLATLYDGFIRPRWIKSYLKTLPRVPANATPPMTPRSATAGGYTNTGYVPCVDTQENANNNAKHGPLEAQFSSTSTSPLVEQVKHQIEKENRIGAADRIEMMFVGFSAYSNTRRIWTLKPREDHIPILNGMRVLSLGWAVLGYTWVLGPLYAETWVTGNIRRTVTSFPSEWSFQFILNFHFCSDTYFVISGLLTTYYWLKWYQKRGRITCGMAAYYFLHRYWKLMVPIMMSLAVYSTFYRFITDGPLAPEQVNDAETCRAGYWWKNMLMLSNVVETDNMCLAWMWYVPAVFQLHLVSILILVPLVLKPWVGYIMMAAMYLAHIGSTVAISHRIHNVDGIALVNWLLDYFFATWCRAAPYVLGLAMGKIIYEIQRKNRVITMHPIVAVIGWLIALALITTPVYVTYDFLRADATELWGTSQWVAWDTLSRTSFGLGISWIIFACYIGYGGLITKLLAYPVWQPFSYISFQSLATGAMLIYSRVYGSRLVLMTTNSTQMYAWYGNMIMSFGFGWLLSLLWVMPLTRGLEKAILCTKRIDWLRAGRHPIEEVNQIEKEYSKVMSGKYEAPYSRQESYHVKDTKSPLYDNSNMSNSNLHQRQNADVEEQKAEPASTAL